MSSDLELAVRSFFESQPIAVAGVSRSPAGTGNAIFRRMKAAGLQVFPTNPAATEIEGVTCYPNLSAIPGGVRAVVVATSPKETENVVRECQQLGISKVWIHRSFGQGSYSNTATQFCREHGISVIDGACPLMYCPPVDPFHRCVRGVFRLFGHLPKPAGDWS